MVGLARKKQASKDNSLPRRNLGTGRKGNEKTFSCILFFYSFNSKIIISFNVIYIRENNKYARAFFPYTFLISYIMRIMCSTQVNLVCMFIFMTLTVKLAS